MYSLDIAYNQAQTKIQAKSQTSCKVAKISAIRIFLIKMKNIIYYFGFYMYLRSLRNIPSYLSLLCDFCFGKTYGKELIMAELNSKCKLIDQCQKKSV